MTSKLLYLKPDKDKNTILLFSLAAIGGGGLVSLLVNLVNDPLLLAVIIVGLIMVAAIAFRLELGLFTLVFITYTRFSDVLVHEHGLPSIAQPLSLLLLAIIFGRWFLFHENPFRQIEMPLIILGAYGLVSFASMLFADDIARTQSALIIYIKDVIVTILVILLLRRVNTLRTLIWILLLAGIFMGSITAYQQITGTYEITYWGFGQAQIKNIVGKSHDYRIAGPIGDPNFYGQILLVLVPLALERVWHEKHPLLRVVAGWGLAVCLLSTVFTFSRGAFLGLIVIALLSVWYNRIRFVPLLVTVLLGSLLIQFIPEQYAERVQTMTDLVPGLGQQDARNEVSFRGRMSAMQAGWLMFKDHPLLGVGLNNYAVHYQTYAHQLGIESDAGEQSAHNLYLEIAAEMGLLGLTVFGMMLAVTFNGLVKAYKKFEQMGCSNEANMARAFMIGLIGYLTAAFFLHASYPRYFWLLFGIALAIAQLAINIEQISTVKVKQVSM